MKMIVAIEEEVAIERAHRVKTENSKKGNTRKVIYTRNYHLQNFKL